MCWWQPYPSWLRSEAGEGPYGHELVCIASPARLLFGLILASTNAPADWRRYRDSDESLFSQRVWTGEVSEEGGREGGRGISWNTWEGIDPIPLFWQCASIFRILSRQPLMALCVQIHDLHSKLELNHPRGVAKQLHKCIVAHSSGRGVFDGNVKVRCSAAIAWMNRGSYICHRMDDWWRWNHFAWMQEFRICRAWVLQVQAWIAHVIYVRCALLHQELIHR